MPISLHNQTTAPNATAATSVSSLERSGSSKTKGLKSRTDIYQTVTDSTIEALETSSQNLTSPPYRRNQNLNIILIFKNK
ncbi:hypothetical protein EC836_103451 [Erwinia sp. JUb26]|nr:hypothetical protein EC836_103451 [Erwinia sp. JUb26]